MKSDTMIPAEIWTVAQTEQGNVVFVRPKEADVVVPIFIGPVETQAILIGLGKVNTARPFTHDLLLGVIDAVGARVLSMEICDLVDGTYFGRLKIIPAGSTDVIIVDARPSDALAVAVRVLCPIYIAEHVVDEAGILIDLVNPENENAVPGNIDEQEASAPVVKSSKETPELEQLNNELKAAVEKEDYETAACIRDKIKELQNRAHS